MLKSGKCWTRLASYPLQCDMETDLDEIIRRFARLHLGRMELANIQNPRKGDFRAGSTKIPVRARISAGQKSFDGEKRCCESD